MLSNHPFCSYCNGNGGTFVLGQFAFCKHCNGTGKKIPPGVVQTQPGEKEHHESPQSSGIEATLQERGKRYGEYSGHAQISQSLKDVARHTSGWERLSHDQRETLDMIFHKIGRILNGDPTYHDSWHDIVGYAKLSADLLLGKSV